MKKLFLAAAVALMAIAAPAKTADELRVYINPGHGSWTANDRPMAIIGHGTHSRYNTDTLSFFESNTNLRKGFGVLEKLRAFGLKYDETLNQTGERHQIGAARDMSNNIVMSHVKCGPYHDDNPTAGQVGEANVPVDHEYYNRSLTEICEEVEANNFDMFISIHSNAVDSSGWKTTNFPIVLYRGYDDVTKTDTGIDNAHTTACKAMAQKIWPYHMGNTHEQWTAYSKTNMNIRGDINFYGSSSVATRKASGKQYKGYLGVLKHGAPGFLVEGYFHQYAPAALRHMNWDVDYVEGYNYAHGIADYFGLTKEKTGDIYGIVRDEHEKFDHEKYVAIPGTPDVYKPLNGVVVTLKKDGNVVATYTTDDQYNGAFVFKGVEPGAYKLTFACEGYKAPKAVDVTVKAAELSYPTAFMESESYVAPTIVYSNYPDVLAGTSFGAREAYGFKAAKSTDIAALADCTIKRLIARDGMLYILAKSEEDGGNKILILDAATHKVLSTPTCATCTEGTQQTLADIQITADGYLVGCNETLCHYDATQVQTGEVRGTVNIYKWDMDEDTQLPAGEPKVWLTTQKSGNMYRAYTGRSMYYSGTTDEGTILMSSTNANTTVTPFGKMFFSVISVNGGKKLTESHRNNGTIGVELATATIGTDFNLTVSPLGDDKFMISSSQMPTTHYALGSGAGEMENLGAVAEDLMPAAAHNADYFKYAGKAYMVAPVLADGKLAGLKLIDLTDGTATAAAVPTEGLTFTGNGESYSLAGATVVSYNALDKIQSANIALYVLQGSTLRTFTTEGVRQPQGKREFAYDIVLTTENNTYTVTFKATGDAPEGNIVLTNTHPDFAEDIVRIPTGAITKGENSVSFSKEDLGGLNYKMGVELINKSIPATGEYFSDPNGVTKRGGVVTITNPEYDNVGYVAVTTGGACGTKIYAPDGTVSEALFVNDSRLEASNQSSMFRGDERNGKAVFSDWSDGGAGYWVIDPANPIDMSQLLAGQRSGSTGSYAYNGKIIGGGSSCVAFQGNGADQKMYSFLEDYPAGNTPGKQNAVYRYDIGDAEQITTIPAKKFDDLNGAGMLANQNVEIRAIENGFFVSQCRGEGNNATGCPGFVYLSNDGEILLNSGKITEITSCNSGIAINPSRTLFAVAQYSCISIFSIDWNEYDEPTLTALYDIPYNVKEISWSQMAFDPGDNLHVFEREDGGYHAYSLQGQNPATYVPAKSIYMVEGTGSGVEEISLDATVATDAIYYNLNGVRMTGSQLPVGIYIKVQGSKASKVIVR